VEYLEGTAMDAIGTMRAFQIGEEGTSGDSLRPWCEEVTQAKSESSISPCRSRFMPKKKRTEVKVEETRKETTCEALGLKYKSRTNIVRITEILGTPEGQAELDLHCGSTATKFKDLLAGIGTHIPAAGIVAVALEFLKGGPK
jgi:hypothetical protein